MTLLNGNAQHPVITPSDVNNALSNVTSKDNLSNGEAKLNAAKQEANTALGHLNNLNNAQRLNDNCKLMVRIKLMQLIQLSKMQQT
ncbi:hypothetical protein ACVNPX_02150 [Staphylococcus aureus]